MTWTSSVTFRRFRNRHTELGKVHWTHQLGADLITSQLKSETDDSKMAAATLPASFKSNMLPLSVREMRTWMDDYVARSRLHLLLVCAANLEYYLHEVTVLHLLSMGYRKKDGTLSAVGDALGKPIIGRASLPEPLKYAEEFFGVSYGTHRTTWDRSYKLRCAVAHSGGAVSLRTIRELPDLKVDLHDILGMSWNDLRESLNAADQIATVTDQKVSTPALRTEEAHFELRLMKKSGTLPPRAKVWEHLSNAFSIRRISRPDKALIEKDIYT